LMRWVFAQARARYGRRSTEFHRLRHRSRSVWGFRSRPSASTCVVGTTGRHGTIVSRVLATTERKCTDVW